MNRPNSSLKTDQKSKIETTTNQYNIEIHLIAYKYNISDQMRYAGYVIYQNYNTGAILKVYHQWLYE